MKTSDEAVAEGLFASAGDSHCAGCFALGGLVMSMLAYWECLLLHVWLVNSLDDFL